MVLSRADLDDLTRRGADRGVDLRPGLVAVEDQMRATVVSRHPFVTDASHHLIDAGGKRFRPMLVLLAGMAGGAQPTNPDLVSAGVIVELVHLSTLYHDDVIDAADTRRGAPSAHVKWSNTVAILTGDFLLARASELSASLGVEVTRIMARTISDLCQGQLLEVQGSLEAERHGAHRIEPSRGHYLEVIGLKTASLIAAACRLGGLLSGQPRGAVETLTEYGWRLGLSFQLADDVLDVASEATESGKVPGTDLREGVRTLPVLLALEADGPGSRLARLIADPTDAHVEEALALLRVHPALEQARQVARDEAAKATAALAELRPWRSDRPAGGRAAPNGGGSSLGELTRIDGNAAAVDGMRWLADYASDRAG